MAEWTKWDFSSLFDKATVTGLEAVGFMLESHAKRAVPVKTGRLRGSISHATQQSPARVGGKAMAGDGVSTPDDKYTLHVGTNVEYAPHVEYGTKRTRAQPYLRPAIDNNYKRATDLFNRELKRVLASGR